MKEEGKHTDDTDIRLRAEVVGWWESRNSDTSVRGENVERVGRSRGWKPGRGMEERVKAYPGAAIVLKVCRFLNEEHYFKLYL